MLASVQLGRPTEILCPRDVRPNWRHISRGPGGGDDLSANFWNLVLANSISCRFSGHFWAKSKGLKWHFLIMYVIILRKFKHFPDGSDLRKSRDSRLESREGTALAYLLILSEKPQTWWIGNPYSSPNIFLYRNQSSSRKVGNKIQTIASMLLFMRWSKFTDRCIGNWIVNVILACRKAGEAEGVLLVTLPELIATAGTGSDRHC